MIGENHITTLSLEMINTFHLSALDRSAMDQYYILHWTGQYYNKESRTIIEREGMNYLVCPQGDLVDATEVALSFRFCRRVNNVHGYVLVRKVK